jgi:hypothetical protein
MAFAKTALRSKSELSPSSAPSDTPSSAGVEPFASVLRRHEQASTLLNYNRPVGDRANCQGDGPTVTAKLTAVIP